MNTVNCVSGSFRLGWRLVFFAGLIPGMAGLAMLLLAAWSSTAGTNEPWLSLVGRHSFSAAQLAGHNRELIGLWILTVHLCGVNLAMSGAFISSISILGLKERKRWAWILLLIAFIWVGGSDVFALMRYRLEVGSGVPIAIIPLTLGSVGLWLTRPGKW